MSLVDTNVDTDTRVAEIVLNRPEKLNAISPELELEFFAALHRLGQDETVRCIVIRGNGRAFCAGYDLMREREERTDAWKDWVDFQFRLDRWMTVRNTPVPVVAAIHGYCFGIATLMGSLCDLVVIAEDTIWGSAQVRGGGGYNGPTLAYQVGHRKAREIDFRSARLSGDEAARIGWANYAVPASEVLDLAREIAADIAKTPRETLVIKKHQLNRLMDAQGFKRSLDDGGLVHTVLDFAPSVREMMASLEAVGLRDTVAKWA